MSSLQYGSQPEAPDFHIPRFLWRVESRNSWYRVLECSHWASQHVHCNNDDLRSWISAHMESRHASYHAPFVITSLTGSLLWALNYAHWLLSRGEAKVSIVLLDAWSALTEHIYPAKYLAARLEIAPLGVTWHDDPYHEYFVFGDFPGHAILGSVALESTTDRDLNTLVPGFSTVDPDEHLHESLRRFQTWRGLFDTPVESVRITNNDLWAALAVASKFIRTPDPDIQFQLTMMFLALRNRDWYQPDLWPNVRNMFRGVRIPPLYLYRSWAVPIDPQLPDVVGWVRGVERIRLECSLAKRTPGLGIRADVVIPQN